MYTIGTDIEVFLQKDGEFISAIPYTEGTKNKPVPLPSEGFVSYDNVALEFGVPPATNGPGLVNYIGATLKDLYDYLPEGIEMAFVPSADFPVTELEHEEAKRFGCSPDFNAWTNEVNKIDSCEAAVSVFRTCGAHVHVRDTENSEYPFLSTRTGKQHMCMAMDIMLGIPCTLLDNSPAAINRRQLYGKAGCYRETPGGMEYRSLSNFWCQSPSLVQLIVGLTEDALRLVKEDKLGHLIGLLGGPQRIQELINEGNEFLACDLVASTIMDYMSPETAELFMLCASNQEIVNIKKEWGII